MPCPGKKHSSNPAEQTKYSLPGRTSPRSARAKSVGRMEVTATPPPEPQSRASPRPLDLQDLFPYTQFLQSSGVGPAIFQAFSEHPVKSRSCPQIYTSPSSEQCAQCAQCTQLLQPAVVNPYERPGAQTPPLELVLRPRNGPDHVPKPCPAPCQLHSHYQPHFGHMQRQPASPSWAGPEHILCLPRHSSAPLTSAPQRPSAVPTPAETQKLLRYQCSRCLKVFTRSSALQSHILVHTGDRPFVCPHSSCSKSFNVKSNMNRHFKTHRQLGLRRDST